MHIVPTFLYDVSGSLAEQKLDRLHCQSFDYILQQLARKSVATVVFGIHSGWFLSPHFQKDKVHVPSCLI